MQSFKSTPYHSAASRATFNSNNLKPLFSIWLYQSLTPMEGWFILLCRHFLFTALLSSCLHFNFCEIGTLTGPSHFDCLFFFSHPFCCIFVPLLRIRHFYLAKFKPSFSYCTEGLKFDFTILWHTKELMVDSVIVRCPDAVAAQQA